MSDFVTIYAEATPNPDSMKFVVSKMILPNDSVDYRTREKAEGNSPLAVEIFDTFKFANGVFIMNNFIYSERARTHFKGIQRTNFIYCTF